MDAGGYGGADTSTASILTLALAGRFNYIRHVPNEGAGSRYEPSDDQIVDAQALFIERVLRR